jgi:hypothetical protein
MSMRLSSTIHPTVSPLAVFAESYSEKCVKDYRKAMTSKGYKGRLPLESPSDICKEGGREDLPPSSFMGPFSDLGDLGISQGTASGRPNRDSIEMNIRSPGGRIKIRPITQTGFCHQERRWFILEVVWRGHRPSSGLLKNLDILRGFRILRHRGDG